MTTTPRADFAPSPHLARCRRRARADFALAAGGMVVVAALTRRWRAPWIVPAAGLALVAVDHWTGWYDLWADAQLRGDAPTRNCAVLQPAVDDMAATLGLRPPHVMVQPVYLQTAAASRLHPPRIYVHDSNVPPSGVDPQPWTFGILAHEIGHHWLRLETSLTPYLAGGPVLVAVLGAGTRSLRRWAAVAGAAMVLVMLPGLAASRWSERGADAVACQLGHGSGLASYAEWCRLHREPRRRWWRRLFDRRPQILRSHPLGFAAPG